MHRSNLSKVVKELCCCREGLHIDMLTGINDVAEAEDLRDLGVAEDLLNPVGGGEDTREIFLLKVNVTEDTPFWWFVVGGVEARVKKSSRTKGCGPGAGEGA